MLRTGTAAKRRQLSFFFDPSRRTRHHSNTPSAIASSANHTHSPHETSSAVTIVDTHPYHYCAFCQDTHLGPCPYAE